MKLPIAASLPYPIHMIASVLTQIDQGEDPWFALGYFLHDWWCYALDYRQKLIGEPLPPVTTLEGERRMAFCAATVEELCLRAVLPSPDWLAGDRYRLETPWFLSPPTSQSESLLAAAPGSFRRRNVFVSGNVLDNKYELSQTFGSKLRCSLWSDQDLQKPLEGERS